MKIIILIVISFILLFSIWLFLSQNKSQKDKLKIEYSNLKSNYSNLPKKNSIRFPILYINLDRSSDRRKFMENQFKDFNITNYTRIPAVDGKKINYKNGDLGDFKFINNYPENSSTILELACTLSHIRAIKYAYENNLGTVLILEDDADLSLMPYWKYCPSAIEKMAPNNWELIQLQSIEDNNKIDMNYNFTPQAFGAVAYLINRNGQQKIYNLFFNNILHITKIKNTYLVSDSFIFDKLNTYKISTPLITPFNEYLESTVHDNHTSWHNEISNDVRYMYFKYFDKKCKNNKSVYCTGI